MSLRGTEVTECIVAHGWVRRVNLDQRVRNHCGGRDAGKPLAVGRNYVPRRARGAGVTEHLRERLLVGVPKSALFPVVRGKFPIMVGQIDTPKKADALPLLRQVQEQLDDAEPVLRQLPLPAVDRFVPAFPDMMLARLGRELFAEQVLRVHPDDQHLLVVRPVKDADLPPRRQPLLVAAQEVLIELAHRRDLEALDPHALRVDTAHHAEPMGIPSRARRRYGAGHHLGRGGEHTERTEEHGDRHHGGCR